MKVTYYNRATRNAYIYRNAKRKLKRDYKADLTKAWKVIQAVSIGLVGYVALYLFMVAAGCPY